MTETKAVGAHRFSRYTDSDSNEFYTELENKLELHDSIVWEKSVFQRSYEPFDLSLDPRTWRVPVVDLFQAGDIRIVELKGPARLFMTDEDNAKEDLEKIIVFYARIVVVLGIPDTAT